MRRPYGQDRAKLCRHVATVIIFLSACANIHLISDYDEVTDKSLTAIQQSVEDFIEKLKVTTKTVDASFEKSKTFYETIDRDLRRLEFRVSAIPKNEKTIDLVTKVRITILGTGECSEEGTSLKDLHCMKENRARGPSVASLTIAQRNINQAISAALALELAKKQGSEPKQ